jgi:hypothetical protein
VGETMNAKELQAIILEALERNLGILAEADGFIVPRNGRIVKVVKLDDVRAMHLSVAANLAQGLEKEV